MIETRSMVVVTHSLDFAPWQSETVNTMLLWDLRENTDRKLPVLCHHTVIICHVWPHKHTALEEPVEITEAQVVVDKMRLPQTDLKSWSWIFQVWFKLGKVFNFSRPRPGSCWSHLLQRTARFLLVIKRCHQTWSLPHVEKRDFVLF